MSIRRLYFDLYFFFTNIYIYDILLSTNHGGVITIYVWLFILVVTIVLEAITPNLATIWFIPAAIISFILAVFHIPLWIQIAAFISTSLILLFTTKPFFEKLLRRGPVEQTNSFSLIGKSAQVVERIDNLSEKGAVRIEGKVWTARNIENNDPIEEGETVTVSDIQGVKLMCTK